MGIAPSMLEVGSICQVSPLNYLGQLRSTICQIRSVFNRQHSISVKWDTTTQHITFSLTHLPTVPSVSVVLESTSVKPWSFLSQHLPANITARYQLPIKSRKTQKNQVYTLDHHMPLTLYQSPQYSALNEFSTFLSVWEQPARRVSNIAKRMEDLSSVQDNTLA